MKKYIVLFVVFVLIFSFTSSAKAYTVNDLFKQVTALQGQVKSLQARLSANVLNAVKDAKMVVPTTNEKFLTLDKSQVGIKTTSPVSIAGSSTSAIVATTTNNSSENSSNVQLPSTKVYRALISQSLTNDPTVDTIFENTTGGKITFARLSSGRYYVISSNSAFVYGKVLAIMGNTVLPTFNTISETGANNSLIIATTTRNSNTSEDDNCLAKTPIEIIIYP